MAEKSRENEELRRQLEGLQQRWDGVIQVNHPGPRSRIYSHHLASQDRATINLELKDLKDGHHRLELDAQKTQAELDAARDREFELSTELGSAKRQVESLEQQLAGALADDREKKKAEMLAEMMARIDTVSSRKTRTLRFG